VAIRGKAELIIISFTEQLERGHEESTFTPSEASEHDGRQTRLTRLLRNHQLVLYKAVLAVHTVPMQNFIERVDVGFVVDVPLNFVSPSLVLQGAESPDGASVKKKLRQLQGNGDAPLVSHFKLTIIFMLP
jgi:hypothetical protein